MSTPAITPEITRADAADYLDRSNWNPDQARALAAKETLTNLGAHPAAVDKAATPDSFSIPSPGLGKPQTVAPIAAVPQAASVATPSSSVKPKPMSRGIDFSDLGGKVVSPAGTGGIDFSDLGGKMVAPAGKTSTPEAESETSRALRAPGEEIRNTIQGIGSIGTDVGKAAQGGSGSVVRDVLGKLNPVGVVAYDKAKALTKGVGDAFRKGASEDSIPGKILGTAENLPMVGDIVQEMEQGHPASAVTRGLTRAALLKAPVPEAEGAKALPTSEKIAGTELPMTVGQAVTKANPESIVGPSLSGVENMSKNLPFTGGPLKEVGRAQQAGARDILASKAATTGAEVSGAPEHIEQNFSNAVDKAREQGTAKYQAIAEAADKADLSKPVSSASAILGDQELVKVLPKSAKDALGKVASSLTEREQTARAIYGKAHGDLDASQQAEVGKAMQGAPEPAGIKAVLDARSELASAANTLKDPADRFRLHGALGDFDSAVNESLASHDKAAGTNLVSDLTDAKKLWTQKYAFDNFKSGLQQIMRGQPAQGAREISGQGFQRLINKLDPPGGLKGQRTSVLQRMFPDDPQSVKDLHDLADFMGKNQLTAAGGMGKSMASMRVLGLKESAAALLTNATGFSYLMAHPGGANVILNALKAGKDTAKLSAAAGLLNHLADEVGGTSDASQDPQRENVAKVDGVADLVATPASPANDATNQNATPKKQIPPSASATATTITPPTHSFEHPKADAVKRKGWAAALRSKNTPDHLRPHLEKNLAQ